jgi:hypothetical protein
MRGKTQKHRENTCKRFTFCEKKCIILHTIQGKGWQKCGFGQSLSPMGILKSNTFMKTLNS